MVKINLPIGFAAEIWRDGRGTQKKFYKNGVWYKRDTLGHEGFAEVLSSVVLKHSNAEDYVTYELCEINGKPGCKSDTFLRPREHFASFASLYQYCMNRSLSGDILAMDSAEERLHSLLNFVLRETGLDATSYLQKTLALDLIVLNPDRHFDNLGFVVQEDGSFRLAPIFDNGQGLFQNWTITPPDLTDDEKRERLCAATICGNFEEQVLAAGNTLQIDYEALYEDLEFFPDSSAKRCLLFQLEKYEKMFAMTKDVTYER